MNVTITEAARAAARELGYPDLKSEQLAVITKFVSGQDVFAVLPTGYGKSLCYACLPFVFDKLGFRSSIVIVATPLTAIMKDQVASFTVKGLTTAFITGETEDEVKQGVRRGQYQLVFFTPELLIDHRKWRTLVNGDVYSGRLKAFIVDEAHCVKTWGESFRRVLKRIGEVRSILPSGVNIMALTATATGALRRAIAKTIGLCQPFVLAVSPCKANMMFTVGTFTSIEDTFGIVVSRIRRERTATPRVIIYCRSFEVCADLYIYFRDELAGEFTEPVDAPDLSKYRMVDMFTSVTDQPIKDQVITSFTSNSQLRIVIATVAFGMGIDCADVRQVIHLGVPDDIESYIQETGRAGRDGEPSLATLLCVKGQHRGYDDNIKNYTTNTTVCRRDTLFNDIDEYEHVDLGTPCLCCDICAKSCSCKSCQLKLQSFTFVGGSIL